MAHQIPITSSHRQNWWTLILCPTTSACCRSNTVFRSNNHLLHFVCHENSNTFDAFSPPVPSWVAVVTADALLYVFDEEKAETTRSKVKKTVNIICFWYQSLGVCVIPQKCGFPLKSWIFFDHSDSMHMWCEILRLQPCKCFALLLTDMFKKPWLNFDIWRCSTKLLSFATAQKCP